MTWTIERVERECKRIAEMQGEVLNTPVKINSRLTRTLGRVRYEYRCGIPVSTSIEFSKSFLENNSDEEILQVILHEMAHWLVTAKTSENHGHDRVFKDMCARIGCVEDMTFNKGSSANKESLENRYKYVIICENCGPITGKSRMCKTLKDIDYCKCSKCKGKVTYIQNW